VAALHSLLLAEARYAALADAPARSAAVARFVVDDAHYASKWRDRRGRTCSRCGSPRSLSLLRFVAVQAAASCRTCRCRSRRSSLGEITSKPYGDPLAVTLDDAAFIFWHASRHELRLVRQVV
jgi:hypothetical protein